MIVTSPVTRSSRPALEKLASGRGGICRETAEGDVASTPFPQPITATRQSTSAREPTLRIASSSVSATIVRGGNNKASSVCATHKSGDGDHEADSNPSPFSWFGELSEPCDRALCIARKAAVCCSSARKYRRVTSVRSFNRRKASNSRTLAGCSGSATTSLWVVGCESLTVGASIGFLILADGCNPQAAGEMRGYRCVRRSPSAGSGSTPAVVPRNRAGFFVEEEIDRVQYLRETRLVLRPQVRLLRRCVASGQRDRERMKAGAEQFRSV